MSLIVPSKSEKQTVPSTTAQCTFHLNCLKLSSVLCHKTQISGGKTEHSDNWPFSFRIWDPFSLYREVPRKFNSWPYSVLQLAVTNWHSWSHWDGMDNTKYSVFSPQWVTVIFASSSTCSNGRSTRIGLKFTAFCRQIGIKESQYQISMVNCDGATPQDGSISTELKHSSAFLPALLHLNTFQNPSLACFQWKLPLAPQQTAKPPHSRWVYEFCEDFSSLNSILQFQNSFY